MAVDFGTLETTIDNFEKGNIARDKFLSYLRTQMQQAKTETEQMSQQLEAARNAAKMAQQNISRKTEQGIGNTQTTAQGG